MCNETAEHIPTVINASIRTDELMHQNHVLRNVTFGVRRNAEGQHADRGGEMVKLWDWSRYNGPHSSGE